jgi:hypothetical protein
VVAALTVPAAKLTKITHRSLQKVSLKSAVHIAEGAAEPAGPPLYDLEPPGVGAIIRTTLGEVVLTACPGTVYTTSNPDWVCKVYDRDALSSDRRPSCAACWRCNPISPRSCGRWLARGTPTASLSAT